MLVRRNRAHWDTVPDHPLSSEDALTVGFITGGNRLSTPMVLKLFWRRFCKLGFLVFPGSAGRVLEARPRFPLRRPYHPCELPSILAWMFGSVSVKLSILGPTIARLEDLCSLGLPDLLTHAEPAESSASTSGRGHLQAHPDAWGAGP